MAANFLHGVESILLDDGIRSIREVKTAVIAVIGTAPIQTVEAEDQTVNQPVLLLDDREAVRYFGADTAGYTLPAALNTIFDYGYGVVIAINVFDPAVHETSGTPDPSLVVAADIIGGVDGSGSRTGLQILKDVYSLYGFTPKTIICPGFSSLPTVATEMLALTSKVRAIALIDAPLGVSRSEAVTGRGGTGPAAVFNVANRRAVLCYPHVQANDRLEPLSQHLAGVMAKNDRENGYWFSPSNKELLISGLELPLTAAINDPDTDVNLLNENGIVTVFNAFGTGYRTWGNRSSAWPSDTGVLNFIAGTRVIDIMTESLELSMLPFVDRPLNDATLDAVVASSNSFVRVLIGRGALLEGSRVSYRIDRNPQAQLQLGQAVFSITAMFAPPLERITYEVTIDTGLLQGLGQPNVVQVLGA